jgi:peptide deformylase
MAILKIVKYGDPILERPATRVNFNTLEKKLPKIIEDMTHTCLASAGVGLAAPQAGLDLCMAVIMLPVGKGEEQTYKRYVLINPEISQSKGAQISAEGCLSFPGLEIELERALEIKVKYLNENGLPVELKAQGYFAIILQHEIDHLYGKTFITRLKGENKKEALKQLAELKKNWK